MCGDVTLVIDGESARLTYASMVFDDVEGVRAVIAHDAIQKAKVLGPMMHAVDETEKPHLFGDICLVSRMFNPGQLGQGWPMRHFAITHDIISARLAMVRNMTGQELPVPSMLERIKTTEGA